MELIPGGSQTNSKRAGGTTPSGSIRSTLPAAKGARIWDVDGNEYLDYVNGLGPISLGYDYPAVTAAIRDQLDRGTISGLLWPAEVEAGPCPHAGHPVRRAGAVFQGWWRSDGSGGAHRPRRHRPARHPQLRLSRLARYVVGLVTTTRYRQR